MHLSKEQKTLSEVFYAFLECKLNSQHLEKKRWPSQLMYFWNYTLWYTCLNECVKSTISEDPSTWDIVNSPKHCWNLIAKTLAIFIDHCESSWVGKSLCEWYAKS